MSLLDKTEQSNYPNSCATRAVAVNFLKKASALGNPLSSEQLGWMSLEGKGVPHSSEEAAKYFTQTINQIQKSEPHKEFAKPADVFFALGEIYLKRNDDEKAIAFLYHAVSHGHPAAQGELNVVYQTIVMNKLKAEHQKGNLAASIELGERHLSNSHIRGNYAQAVDCFNHVVNMDKNNYHPRARELLALAKDLAIVEEKCPFGKIDFNSPANMFCDLAMKFQPAPHQNVGMPTDKAKSIDYFKKAADAGSGFAAYMLSLILIVDSHRYLVMASKLGYVTASLDLGNFYSSCSDENADGEMYSPTAVTEAVNYYELAIKQEEKKKLSEQNKGLIQITKSALQEHQNLQALINKSKAGDAIASNALAAHYRDGTCNRRKNPNVAIKYLTIASAQGSGDASYELIEHYAKNESGLSQKFLTKAAEQGHLNALIKISRNYVENDGVKVSSQMIQDLSLAYEMPNNLSKKGELAFLLGEVLMKRSLIKSAVIKGEFSEGLGWLKKAAENGYFGAAKKLFLLQGQDSSFQVDTPTNKRNGIQST